VAVAPDLPGIADPEKIPNSSGPWKLPYSAGRWIAEPDATSSVIFDGVLAAVQSLYLLRSQPDVMTDRIGVGGVSWGGYSTAMVCGLTGADVKAGFALYGCGFYDKEEGAQMAKGLDTMASDQRQRWLAWLDAGRRAGGIKAAYFIGAAANDIYFYPPAVEATLAEISSEKNQVYSPNAAHQLPVPGGTKDAVAGENYTKMEIDYFAWHLKGEGKPFPKVTVPITQTAARADGTITVRFSVDSPLDIRPAQVYYSLADTDWPHRKWEAVPATSVGHDTYEATLPPLAGAADWFALVSDGRPVSVSSLMQHYPSK
jgi:dienelactone hydrolase